MILAGLFCATLATGVVVGMSTRNRETPGGSLSPNPRLRAPLGVALVAGSLAVVGLLLSAQIAGVTMRFAYTQPTLFRSLVNDGGQFYVTGVSIALAWLPFWLALVLIPRDQSWRVPCIALTFIFGAVLIFPYGQRSYYAAPLLAMIAWRERNVGAIKLRAIVPLTVLVILGAGAYATFRVENTTVGDSAQVSARQSVTDFSGRFDSFDFFAQTYQTYDGRLWGRTLLDLATQPVPRSLFPDKPSQTSAYLITLQQPETDRTFTPEYGIVTELWINAGTGGVILGGLFFGWLVGRMSVLAERSMVNPRRALMVLPFLTFPAQWLLGGINSFTTIVLILFGTIYVGIARFVVRR
ncbi:hypothetical protein EDD33_3426 [Nocardioides aurantiacus]|uniref:Oligosaccharide repeat unit polymerase n=2 Tax=Nocardioides aurantiacus TaxID=86796 RepID=A0A3N2CYB1_9ACTN|nr:hypothetical protein EDD33_3426 [Nocardioides aurantiacus]